MLQVEETSDFSCLVCLVRDNLININTPDTNNVEWKSKLTYCIPEIDWNIVCFLCQLCAGQLDLLCNFRNQCMTSYYNVCKSWRCKLDLIEHNCLICRLEFKSAEELNTHLKTHVNCTGCDASFQTTEDLRTHEIQAHSFVCFHCSERFYDKDKLSEHIKNDHEDDPIKIYTCDCCELVFTTKKKLEIHKVDCIKESDDIIDRPDSEEEVKIKKRGRKPKDKTISKCTLCGIVFSTKYLLNRHVRNVHATEKIHNCDICTQKFASAVYLAAHKKYHSGDRPHICSFCGKGYITASDLYHHEKIHANKRAYKCEKCPKAFNTSSDLHKHRICVHIDRLLWKYVCTYCERRFPLKTNLDTHTKTHTGEKNYACHLCERRCINRSVLQRHIESHSNVRSFKCSHCNQEYKYQKSLNIHLAKAHGIGDTKIPERVKKYFCHICPKSYFANNKLQKHIRSHTGERPFSCQMCDKRFIDKSYVKQHLKTAHNVILANAGGS